MDSYEGFAGHLNETFQVALGTSSVEMTLVKASKGTARGWDGLRKQPFSLYFKCAKPVILPQRAYPFEKAGFGRMDIFIVPVARERDGILYEAVFN